ncbi:hypothetical protein [Streptomyces chartreusis]|uniref:hypothetical protein n=1 Tax=Streptomyces chartreusis TaxID=1969 RepID=UPI003D71BBFD
MTIVTATGLGILLCTAAGALTGRLAVGPGDGLAALGFALIAVGRMDEAPPAAVVNTALAAYFAYRWWNGRDDQGGTRRRLREGLRHFTGRRRTAPSHG